MAGDRWDAEARRLSTPDERGIIAVWLWWPCYEASVRDLAAALRAAEMRGAERVRDAAARHCETERGYYSPGGDAYEAALDCETGIAGLDLAAILEEP